MNPDFAQNLRLLCSFYRSISDVCRRIGISRAQFNRYLAGSSQPSLYNVRRIGAFFGVEPDELMLDHSVFRQLVDDRPRERGLHDPLISFVHDFATRFPHSQRALRRYLGYYNVYYVLPYDRSLIQKSVSLVYQKGERTYVRAILTRPGRKELHPENAYWGRFDGVAVMVEDRLYLVEYEARSPERFGMTILYPSHKTSVATLTGLYLGVSSSDLREPISIAIHYRFLGKDIDLRSQLRTCGILERGHPAIPSGVEQRLLTEENRSHHTREDPGLPVGRGF